MTDRTPEAENKRNGKVAEKSAKPIPALVELVRLMARIEAEATFANSSQDIEPDKMGEGIE